MKKESNNEYDNQFLKKVNHIWRKCGHKEKVHNRMKGPFMRGKRTFQFVGWKPVYFSGSDDVASKIPNSYPRNPSFRRHCFSMRG